jgi:hypothetical protein
MWIRVAAIERKVSRADAPILEDLAQSIRSAQARRFLSDEPVQGSYKSWRQENGGPASYLLFFIENLFCQLGTAFHEIRVGRGGLGLDCSN